MNLKKWFRIELDASGAILSCSEVEAASKSRGDVRFVEALDAAGAVVAAQAWRANKNKSRTDSRARMLAANKCFSCGRTQTPERRGKSTCLPCVRKWRERKREVKAGAPLRVKKYLTIEAAWHADLDRTKFGGSIGRLMRRCLTVYDRDPKNFRAWLVQEINRRSAPEKQVQ